MTRPWKLEAKVGDCGLADTSLKQGERTDFQRKREAE